MQVILFLIYCIRRTHNCTDIARAADVLYHLSMTAGMTVLLLRIRAVLPFGWNSYIKSLHVVLVGMRIIIGAVDVVLLERAVLPSGACQFQENKAVSSVWVGDGIWVTFWERH